MCEFKRITSLSLSERVGNSIRIWEACKVNKEPANVAEFFITQTTSSIFTSDTWWCQKYTNQIMNMRYRLEYNFYMIEYQFYKRNLYRIKKKACKSNGKAIDYKKLKIFIFLFLHRQSFYNNVKKIFHLLSNNNFFLTENFVAFKRKEIVA